MLLGLFIYLGLAFGFTYQVFKVLKFRLNYLEFVWIGLEWM
jgi:hypothetical protein